MTWDGLRSRAAAYDVTVDGITETLTERREERSPDGDARRERADAAMDADPLARVVADADVLAASLLVGGQSREAVDRLARHDWTQLIASEPLLSDAETVIAAHADPGLAADWRARIEELVSPVGHPEGDHPALASARSGDARHVLSLGERLRSVGAGTAIRREANVETSVRSPDAFVRLFDPADIYETIYGDTYPGPDRDGRP